jgi:hypothetical protein
MEKDRMYLQANSMAVKLVLQMFAHFYCSPGDKMFYTQNIHHFRRKIEEICEQGVEGPNILNAAYRVGPMPPKNNREKLIYLLIDLLNVKGYVGNSIEELPNGNIVLTVFIKKNNITYKFARFFYDMSGSDPTIIRIVLKNTSRIIHEVPEANLYDVYRLSEIIEKLNIRYHPDRDKTWWWR